MLREIRIAARIQLIGAIEPRAAVAEQARQRPMDDGSAHLTLDIVAHQGQTAGAKLGRPPRIGGDEDGHAIDHGHPSVKTRLGVVAHGLLGAHGQVADQDFRAGLAQDLGHIDRFGIGGAERLILGVVLHVRREAVEHRPHLNQCFGNRQDFLKFNHAIGFGENRLFDGTPDFAPIDIKGGHHLEIGAAPASDQRMHETGDLALVPVRVEVQTLDQSARAIPNACNCHSDFVHGTPPPTRSVLFSLYASQRCATTAHPFEGITPYRRGGDPVARKTPFRGSLLGG